MLPKRDGFIESKFPDLFKCGYSITSPIDSAYNCIGWAAEDKQWWEPDPFFQHYWPPSAPRDYTPQAYFLAYEAVGYKVCASVEREKGYEKIAIYLDERTNQVTHASRQLNSTTWTSKLGSNYDISHTFEALNGNEYASPKFFMKRPLLA